MLIFQCLDIVSIVHIFLMSSLSCSFIVWPLNLWSFEGILSNPGALAFFRALMDLSTSIVMEYLVYLLGDSAVVCGRYLFIVFVLAWFGFVFSWSPRSDWKYFFNICLIPCMSLIIFPFSPLHRLLFIVLDISMPHLHCGSESFPPFGYISHFPVVVFLLAAPLTS